MSIRSRLRSARPALLFFLLLAVGLTLFHPSLSRAVPGRDRAAEKRLVKPQDRPLPDIHNVAPDRKTLPGADLVWDFRTPHPRRIQGEFPGRGDAAPAAAARDFLRARADLLGVSPDLSDVVLTREVESPLGYHLTYQQVRAGLPVFSGQISISMRFDRTIYWVNDDLIPIRRVRGIPRIPAERAVHSALQAVNPTGARQGEPNVELGIEVGKDGEALPAWRVSVVVFSPPASYEVLVNADNGDIVRETNQAKYIDGVGLVFDPDPMKTSGNVGLTDQDDADYAAINAERKSRALLGLAGTGLLDGPHCSTAITSATQARANEPTHTYNYTRNDNRFEEVCCYFHIDTTQRHIQSLGFANVNNRVQPIAANAFNGANAFYSPSTGQIHMGDGGAGGQDMSEDAGVICHEYGHSIQDNQVPGWGQSHEGGSMGEGFGDYLAGSMFAHVRPAWDVYPFPWASAIFVGGNPPSIRVLNSTKHYPENMTGGVHADGEIWSACLWQIRQLVGRNDADSLVLASHFLLSPSASFFDGALAILQANINLRGGAEAAEIRQIFQDRGILPDPNAAIAHVDIQHTWRGDLIVSVGVGDPENPTFQHVIHNHTGGSADDVVGNFALPMAANAFLPPSTTNPWFLRVQDTVGLDFGQIRAYNITFQGSTYDSTDPPVPVIDVGPPAYAFIIPEMLLLSPNGGETFVIGDTVPVRWLSRSLAGGDVQVDISRDAGLSWSTLFASTPNDRIEDWPVAGPSTLQGRMRVTWLSNPSFTAASASDFSIIVPELHLDIPNGGEAWPPGAVRRIYWSSLNMEGNVAVDLSRDGGASWENIIADTPNDGFEDWRVTTPNTDNALIRLRSIRYPNVQAVSANPFRITPAAVTVLSPNGGEVTQVGATLDISWDAPSVGGDLAIDLSRDNGTTFANIVSRTENDGQHAWVVTGPRATNAKVRVRSLTTALSDVSDASFAIQLAALNLTAPNGGEHFGVGSTRAITWSSTDLAGTVSVELSRNGGGSWTPLFTGIANDGSENWVVTGPETTNALARIRSDSIPVLSDTSNSAFTIEQPVIAVTQPNGGENYAIGSAQSIRWNSTAVEGNVDILLSLDGGGSFAPLFSNVANNGNRPWTVGNTPTDTARVRVQSTTDPSIRDDSDTSFRISRPPITIAVLTPNGGERWAIGSSQTISWDSSETTGTVMIELSRNNGTSWETLFASTANDESEAWTVTGGQSSNCLIRITSNEDAATDRSNAVFRITRRRR